MQVNFTQCNPFLSVADFENAGEAVERRVFLHHIVSGLILLSGVEWLFIGDLFVTM